MAANRHRPRERGRREADSRGAASLVHDVHVAVGVIDYLGGHRPHRWTGNYAERLIITDGKLFMNVPGWSVLVLRKD